MSGSLMSSRAGASDSSLGGPGMGSAHNKYSLNTCSGNKWACHDGKGSLCLDRKQSQWPLWASLQARKILEPWAIEVLWFQPSSAGLRLRSESPFSHQDSPWTTAEPGFKSWVLPHARGKAALLFPASVSSSVKWEVIRRKHPG